MLRSSIVKAAASHENLLSDPRYGSPENIVATRRHGEETRRRQKSGILGINFKPDDRIDTDKDGLASLESILQVRTDRDEL
jgi:hypothetical protein